MRLLFTTILIVLFSITMFSQPGTDNRGYIVNVGDLAPDFTIQLDNGENFKLSDYRGKVVMLQFTASWCGVCRKEMPFIEKEIWQELKGEDFILIGLDNDEPIDKVNKFREQTGITYPMGLDTGGEVFFKYAEKKAGITRNIIIDEEGRIVFLTRLFEREEFDAMKAMIFKMIKP